MGPLLCGHGLHQRFFWQSCSCFGIFWGLSTELITNFIWSCISSCKTTLVLFFGIAEPPLDTRTFHPHAGSYPESDGIYKHHGTSHKSPTFCYSKASTSPPSDEYTYPKPGAWYRHIRVCRTFRTRTRSLYCLLHGGLGACRFLLDRLWAERAFSRFNEWTGTSVIQQVGEYLFWCVD